MVAGQGRPAGQFARLVVAAVDAAHGQHHHRGLQAQRGAGVFAGGHHAADMPRAALQLRHAVAVQQRQATARAGLLQRRDQAQRHGLRRAPHDVIARQAVAVAVAAPLHPVDGGHEGDALAQQPVVHLRARVRHVMARPLQRVFVGRIQLAKAQPVAQRDLGRVGNLHARLQRRAHQRHAAKGPPRQPAQALGRVAVHQRHPLAGAQQFQRGNDAGQAAADDHGVVVLGVHGYTGLKGFASSVSKRLTLGLRRRYAAMAHRDTVVFA
jgi:hypothetical protein